MGHVYQALHIGQGGTHHISWYWPGVPSFLMDNIYCREDLVNWNVQSNFLTIIWICLDEMQLHNYFTILQLFKTKGSTYKYKYKYKHKYFLMRCGACISYNQCWQCNTHYCNNFSVVDAILLGYKVTWPRITLQKTHWFFLQSGPGIKPWASKVTEIITAQLNLNSSWEWQSN